jgi:hypothetical protein
LYFISKKQYITWEVYPPIPTFGEMKPFSKRELKNEEEIPDNSNPKKQFLILDEGKSKASIPKQKRFFLKFLLDSFPEEE